MFVPGLAPKIFDALAVPTYLECGELEVSPILATSSSGWRRPAIKEIRNVPDII
jgi:hypothetical protein